MTEQRLTGDHREDPTKGSLPNHLEMAVSIERTLSPAEEFAVTQGRKLSELCARAEYDKAAQIARRINDRLESEGTGGVVYMTNLCTLGSCLALSGNVDDGRRIGGDAVVYASEHGLLNNREGLWALNNLAVTYQMCGDLEAANRTIMLITGKERTESEAKRLVVEISTALSTEAGIKHEAGDFEGAIAMLERGIQMQRDNPLPTPIYTQKLADKLFFRADIHLEQDEPGKAIPLYEEGIALARPILERSKLHLFPALENLAYACIRTGQYELALSPSKEAVEILEAERGETSESLVEALVLAAVVEAFNTRQDERELIVRAHRLAKVYSDEPGSIEYLGGIGLALTPKTQTTVIEPIARLFGYLQAEDGEPPSEPELVEV